MNLKKLPAALVAALLALAATGCSEDKTVRMKYCATVAALHGSDGNAETQLVGLMENFTNTHGLQRAASQQADTREYQDRTISLDLTLGMGEFGAMVTLFYPGSTGDSVKTDLDSYLAEQVNPVFKVTQCSAIPGFKPPGTSDAHKMG
jgi:hypothetical protein